MKPLTMAAASAAILLAASQGLAATTPGPAQAPSGASDVAKTIAGLKARIAKVRKQVELARDYDEVDNLNSIYNFYVDKALWDQAVDLYAKDGTMELAQRGVYVSQDHIRGFYHNSLGTEGPSVNRLGDHLQIQSVIHIAPDGKTAFVRSRSVQMMGNAGGRASWGGGVYENTAVKEGGVWKMKDFHVFNTWTLDYAGGPTTATKGTLPGPNPRFPPDRPPSLVFADFPSVYDIPIHYKNPVTGK